MSIHGRQDARQHLDALVTDVRRGRGRALVIRGERGAGRTTLVTADLAIRRVVVRGTTAETDVPYAGLHQLTTALAAATPTGDRFAVCTATLDLLLATDEPLLIIVDDAQHLDPASLFVLLFCARRITDTAVGFVLTVCDPGPPLDLPELVLDGLDPAAARALLADHGWPHGAPATDAAVRLTGGNPLALTALATHPDPAELLHGLAVGAVPIPEVLHAMFGARVAALSPAARTAVLIAGVIPPDRVELRVRAGARLGLPVGVWDDPTVTGFVAGQRFCHPLVPSLRFLAGPGERRSVHAAIAAELAGAPEESRYHRAQATAGPDSALAAAVEADAYVLEQTFGPATAVDALTHAARLGDGPADRSRRLTLAARIAWKAGNPALAREILGDGRTRAGAVHAHVELLAGDQDTAHGHLLRAARQADGAVPELTFMAVGAAFHAGRVDDAIAAASSIGADPAYRQYGDWLAAALAGRPVETPWRVVDAAPPAVSRSPVYRWLFPLAIATFGQHPMRAREVGIAACGELRAAGMVAMLPMPLAWLADIEFRLGAWTAAAANAAEGLRLAESLDQPPRAADCHALLAQLAAARGERSSCVEHAGQAVALAHRTGNRLAAARATWALGVLALGTGDHATARQHLDALGTDGLATHHPFVCLLATADLVEASARTGAAEHAAEHLTTLRLWAGSDGPAWAHGLLHRGDALLAGADIADKAYLLAREQAQPPFERARSALLHGQFLRRARRVSDAAEPLHLAANLFDDLGARPWTDQATAELRACGEQRAGRTRRDVETLTQQELRVIRLAAEGLSNREIGDRIHLSHRTVGYHLHKAFTKLGVTRRAQLRNRLTG